MSAELCLLLAYLNNLCTLITVPSFLEDNLKKKKKDEMSCKYFLHL